MNVHTKTGEAERAPNGKRPIPSAREERLADFHSDMQLKALFLINAINNHKHACQEIERLEKSLGQLSETSPRRVGLTEQHDEHVKLRDGCEMSVAVHSCATFKEHERKTAFFDQLAVGSSLLAENTKLVAAGASPEQRQIDAFILFASEFGDSIDHLWNETRNMTNAGFWCWTIAYARARKGGALETAELENLISRYHTDNEAWLATADAVGDIEAAGPEYDRAWASCKDVVRYQCRTEQDVYRKVAAIGANEWLAETSVLGIDGETFGFRDFFQTLIPTNTNI